MTPQQRLEFQKNLLYWFENQQRDLPWRKRYLPYEVWISEIMLQQTRVATVIPYFNRWMAALPDIEDVANTDEDSLIKLWEGLGYYSRVRNIQKAAKQIVENYGGEFPSDHEKILALPGIGPYTAGAIASIAFEQDAPIVDGNVIRIISRIEDIGESTKKTSVQNQIWSLAEEWIPKGQARNFNQAMMELGAVICTPQSPQCLLCPIREFCKSYEAGTVTLRPVKEKKKPPKKRTTALAMIKKDSTFFVQKKTQKGIMHGLWEFPSFTVEGATSDIAFLEKHLSETLEQEYELIISKGQEVARFPYMYTNFKVEMICFYYEILPEYVSESRENEEWITFEEISEYAFSSAYTRLWKLLPAKIQQS